MAEPKTLVEIILSSPLTGVIIGSFLTPIIFWIQTKMNKKLEEEKDKRMMYAKLLGLKTIVSNVLVNRYEAYINFYFHRRRWHLRGCLENSLDLEESKKWHEKSDKMIMEVSNQLAILYEILGKIDLLFSKGSIHLIILRIFHYQVYAINIEEVLLTAKDEGELEIIKNNAVQELQNKVEQEYIKDINILIFELEKILK